MDNSETELKTLTAKELMSNRTSPEESEIRALSVQILHDELQQAQAVYARIKAGEITHAELKNYIQRWRQLETLRMSVGDPFERQKLWGARVPEFATGENEEGLGGMTDRDLISEGRNLAHDVENMVKGVRQLIRVEKQLDPETDRENKRVRQQKYRDDKKARKSNARKYKVPKEYNPEDYPSD